MKRLPSFAIGSKPVATIAIGVMPNGVLAIGVFARGVVSVGLVACGSFAAVGILALAPLTDVALFALAAVSYVQRDGETPLAWPRLVAPDFPGERLVVTIAILLATLVMRRRLLRRRTTLASAVDSITSTSHRPRDLFVHDVEVIGDALRLSSGRMRVLAAASEELRRLARDRGRHTPLLVHLKKEEELVEEAVDFRHAPTMRVSYTVLELWDPDDTAAWRLASLHALAAGLAFTIALSATISYALTR